MVLPKQIFKILKLNFVKFYFVKFKKRNCLLIDVLQFKCKIDLKL